MRIFLACVVALSFIGGFGVFAQPEKKTSTTLVFKAKNGNVTFNHSEHVMRANGDCKTCHSSLFREDAGTPLNYKANVHKSAEMNMTSCGSCHRAGGTAFESKGNCNKCHMK